MWPLISDAVGAASSPLQSQEYPENIRAELGLEGGELEEVEVSEQPLEEVLGEVLRWKEHMVVLGISGRGSE